MKKSSYILNIVLLLSFMTVSFTAKAQWNKWHVGGGVGSLTYYGDLSDKFVNANLQELGYHAYAERLIAKRSGIYLRLESVNGHIIGSDRAPKGWINGSGEYFDRALNFRTNIHDVNTSMVFYLGSFKKRERAPFLNAYVRAGIGVGYFDVYGDLKDTDGNFYNYWSDGTLRSLSENDPNANNAVEVTRDYDFETNLRELDIEQSNSRFKWQIPVGLGVKMRLGDVVSLVLDAQYTYSMTDYLDNVGDKKASSTLSDPTALYAADPAGYIGDRARNIKSSTGMKDSYLYVSAGLTFNVGDHSKAKFKTPIYYPKTILPVNDTVEVVQLTNENLDTISKSSEKDSVLQKIIAPSSLSLKMKVDSVILVKSPSDPNKYIVQYYLNVDSLQSEDAQLLYQKEIIVLDTTQLPMIEDSIKYTSAETIISEATDSLQKTFKSDTVLSSQDSIVLLIQQMRKQLDQLQEKVAPADTAKIKADSTMVLKSIVKDSIKNKDTIKKDTIQNTKKVASSLKDSTSKVQVVNPKIDSIVHAENTDSITRVLIPIVDTTKLRKDTIVENALDSSQNEFFEFSPSNYKKEVKDTLQKAKEVPADSILSKKSSSIQSQKDTLTSEIPKPIIQRDTVIIKDTTANQILKDSVQIYNRQQAELKSQIEDLQNQLNAQKDSVVKSQIDTVAAKRVSSANLKDTSTQKLSSTKLDSIKNVDEEKEEMRNQIEELQNQLKYQKDTIAPKSIQIDSSDLKESQSNYNQTIDDLKQKLETLENTSKSQNDSIQNKEAEINQLKSSVKDSVSKKPIASKEDTLQYYERQQEDMKRQIEDLQNQLKSKNEPSNLIVAAVDTSSKIAKTPIVDPSIEAMKQKIIQLENESKAKTDSLKKLEEERNNALKVKSDVSIENAKSNLRTAPSPVNDNSSDSLKRRIYELENQLNSPQRTTQENSRIAPSSYNRNDTIPSTKSNKKVTPNITLSPNLTLGNSKRNRNEPSEQYSSSSRSSRKVRKEKEGVDIGFNYNNQPGFFEARRLKKEGKETLATDDTSSVSDSTDSNTVSTTDSLSLKVTDSTKVLQSSEKVDNTADSLLQAQNELLKAQMSSIQRNQDSLIAVIARLVQKSNQPVETPQPIIIEKEVKVPQKVDSSAIIESLLKQPSTKVFFAVGKSSVATQYRLGLDQLANQLNTYPVLNIRLKGFADPTGNAAANLKLSENRANAVKTYLIQKHNVNPERILVLPAGQEENSSDMSYSRRVEVQLMK